MIKRWLVVSLSVAWVAALLCGLAAGVCEPECPATPTATRKVADPLNCTQYYLCLVEDNSPSDSPNACPAGTFFNPAAKPPDCKATTAPCYPSCLLPNCPRQCVADLDQIFNPNNCSNYYVCVGGNLLGPLECTGNTPYFDGVNQGCSADKTVCCGDPCVAYCYAIGTETPYPHDCTKYYLCSRVGIAMKEDLQSCSSGSNFDVSMGRCVAGAPCNIPCPDNPDVHGETTTTPIPICQESMTCTAVGLFPKCTTCVQQFFNCHTLGQPATVETCIGSKVFNTDPAYPYCVIPTDCPHHPPYKVHHPLY